MERKRGNRMKRRQKENSHLWKLMTKIRSLELHCILKAASYKVSKCNIINSDNEIIYVYSIK